MLFHGTVGWFGSEIVIGRSRLALQFSIAPVLCITERIFAPIFILAINFSCQSSEQPFC